jgi:TorA maturation chaperone TorD
MSTPDQVDGSATLAPEDALRAELYGLLAHLFAAGPGDDLLKSVAASPVELGAEGELLGSAWRSLKAAAGTADVAALEVEHAELFVGTGKARVSIYASHYLSDTWKEHNLVELRDELQVLGLGRQAGVTQPEDHLAALLDVMRHLAVRGDDVHGLDAQRRFFERYLGPWFMRFGADVESVSDAEFYRVAAKMLVAFCELEQQAFRL